MKIKHLIQKQPLIIVLLLIIFSLIGCDSSKKDKDALEVGEYFLVGLREGVFSEENRYYINSPNPDPKITDSIIKKCEDNGFMWVGYFNEHTVLIYEGSIFHIAKGYLITDGTEITDVAEKSEKFGFDPNTMSITKEISNKIYRFEAGL
ncbi:MAG: hypothetical protein NC320_04440 [Clostridium sp.]|nr:hypothetical protein [Clostridium sp.]